MTLPKFPEHEEVLHWVWAEQHFRTEDLQTSDGEAVVVEFPGWANRGAGPDFQEARLQIQEASGEWATHVGAVELHLRSSGWTAHGHHRNPDYNGVVLHVVLYRDRKALASREDGLAIPEVELAPLLWDASFPPHKEAKVRMQKLAALPGRCGVIGTPPNIRRVVEHAAERRLLTKATALLERWDEGDPEELLFQRIFRALGYSAHAQPFEELAKLYPLQELTSHLRQPIRSARATVLSRWFGASGLLDSRQLPSGPTIRRELQQWQSEWKALPQQVRVSKKLRQSSRPQNAPDRRLLAMFHHLRHAATSGLTATWLEVLATLQGQAEQPKFRNCILEASLVRFPTPEWESWEQLGDSGTSTRLVGQDRLVIIWGNALLPFFLAQARRQQDTALEHLLFRIFLVLPPETDNRITRFMQQRLAIKPSRQSPESLGHRQGLIQIHEDFCRNFHQGCRRCELPDLVSFR